MGRHIAIIGCNLGGREETGNIQPFLENLFKDKHIIGLPTPFRQMLAKLISTTRAPKVVPLYEEMGGRSPILPNTVEQLQALETHMASDDCRFSFFPCMRYWHPMTKEVVGQVKAAGATEVILLPLYPQFSTTTTQSSMMEWEREAKKQGLKIPTRVAGCFPLLDGWVEAVAELAKPMIEEAIKNHPDQQVKVLFSAHGLPKKIVDNKGDPYPAQVEATAAAIAAKLNMPELDWQVSYQSKVGPLEWLKPYTEGLIEDMAHAKRPIVIIPTAFVSEHLETLVELDVEYHEVYTDITKEGGYYRVPAVAVHEAFIASLATALQTLIAYDGPETTLRIDGAACCMREDRFNACACEASIAPSASRSPVKAVVR